jgi:endothelin-converting enzyme/putative endopeptidase
MDRSVDPCDDLYTYACGVWQTKNPIPADQARWDVYSKMQVDNQRFLWGLLQDAAIPSANRSATQQKIGDFFAACMDEGAIAKQGIAPLQTDLDRIQKLSSIGDLAALLGDLHAHTNSRQILFEIEVEQDSRDTTKQIAALYAGGIGLPGRDYYLKNDAKFGDTRVRYMQHVARMFELVGAPQESAAASAITVLRIETLLAQATLTKVEQQDPYAIYHRITLPALSKLAPHFNWTAYMKAAGFNPGPWLNLSEPRFLAAVDQLLASQSLSDIKVYLTWALLNTQAQYLSKPFLDEGFAFNLAYLHGLEKQKPRWQRCVAMADSALGEALGKEFVERTFPASVKVQTLRMTQQIEVAMRQRIERLPWMSVTTKTQALAKLAKMRNKIGYPDVWRDYSSVDIVRNDFYGNVVRATAFEHQRNAMKIGRPVDRSEWTTTPSTLDASYDDHLNDITFTAGILLPPLFDPKSDDAPNYGNTGGTIGHELTHGFDNQGRKFDGDGNLRDWWHKKDAVAFEKGAQCIGDQFAQYTVVDDIKLNSKLTAAEDIADLGGLILAWMAWQEQTKSMRLESQDGLTPEQRFFVGYAQWDCGNQRPENLRVRALTSTHSPGKYRINGVVANMPEFTNAFHCAAGKALVKPAKDICKIW